MSLSPGTHLGHYEILSSLGAGGMGEVYRARDAHLGREVAIKLVGDTLAQDDEHLARLEREARLLASLNHPNIEAIYDVEERDGIRFLVLELVEGRGLDEVLADGPLPLREGLVLARQIAGALAAAHAKGVVHRDLKPANVRVTGAGTAKVLDFGLAKSVGGATPPASNSTISGASPTIAGAILGTPAYMSPEQARGKPVDKRADLWAFGCILYEILSGKGAFHRETTSEQLAATLHDDPRWEALPRATPASVRRLLHQCLAKDPERRLGDAAGAAGEIDAALDRLRFRPRRRSFATLAFGALLLVAVAFVVARRTAAPPSAPAPTLAQFTLADGIEESPAFSPDGRVIAYSAEVAGVRKIFTKRLAGDEEARLTTGPFDDIQPAFAPDGKSVAFVRAREPGRRLEPADVFGEHSGGDVWVVDLETRRESKLLDDAFNPAFSPDGKRLAVDAPWVGARRIWITDSSGHNAQQASTDVSEAVAHLRPRWSPDGTRIVFQNMERTKFDVRAVDLTSGALSWITNDLFQDIKPVWSPSGRFVYFSSNRTGGLNLWRAAVAADGKPASEPQQLTTGAGQDVEAAISRDGKHLAFAILGQNADLWKLPVDPLTGRPTGMPQQVVSTTREDSRGAWSPDGGTIAFDSDRSGDANVWLYSLHDRSTRQLTRGPGGDFQPMWSPDGKTIAFFSSRSGNADIWTVEVASEGLLQLTRTQSIDINPCFSPDGRWIAFMSDRSGRLEVWEMGADGSSPRQLTSVGVSGHFLRWTKDSAAVVFRCPCGGKPQTMYVPLDAGEPQPTAEVAGGSHMSFSPDGSYVMDVVMHKTLWLSPLNGGQPAAVFSFEDPDARIDYPVWSPDGRWILFDRFRPQGGDIWVMAGFE